MIQAREAEACTSFVVMEGVRSGWNQDLLMDLTGRYKKEFKGGFKFLVWQLISSVDKQSFYLLGQGTQADMRVK